MALVCDSFGVRFHDGFGRGSGEANLKPKLDPLLDPLAAFVSCFSIVRYYKLASTAVDSNSPRPLPVCQSIRGREGVEDIVMILL